MIKFLIIFLLWCSLAFAGTSQVTVTDSSTSVVTASTTRTVVLIKNTGTTTCYLNDETATTTSFELKAGDIYIATERHSKIAINAITSSGETTLSIWERKS